MTGTLPDQDWMDEKLVTLPGQLTARQASDHLFSCTPDWANRLMDLRNAIVRRLGLIEVGIGDFPVVSEDDREIVLGFDDRHLDFRIRIRVQEQSATETYLAVATLVKLNSLLGRLYLTAVTPFHHAIVASMLARAKAKPLGD